MGSPPDSSISSDMKAEQSPPLASAYNPCPHLATHKSNHGVHTFASLNLKSPVPPCDLCSIRHSRIYLCLACNSISCLDHAISHATKEVGHEIAVDLDRKELFCGICADQIYDPDFDLTKTRDYKIELPWGLRGMNNLGNTCFLNSVLQVLLHAPPLTWHFLGDRRGRRICGRRRRRMEVDGCDLDGVFAAAFSGDRSPYSPARFLHGWWQHAADLATYEQQDAHEFFISVLDWIHCKDQPGIRNNRSKRGSGDCRCIAHRVFSGMLRSQLTCSTCGLTSTTDDPFLDIPLDLPPSPSPSSLPFSLYLFTLSETLHQKIHCRRCNLSQNSLKQMSLLRLPPVLCFHIKRFQHFPKPMKLNQHLEIPFSIDMGPYLSSSATREICTEYDVFAIVSHAGKLEGGHFVTYLMLKGEWYKCDDAWVTRVSEKVVRECQGYMMFYLRRDVCYDAGAGAGCSHLLAPNQIRRESPVGGLLSASACG